MSTQVFPSTAQCPGLDITITRTVEWNTTVQEAVSGKETRVAKRQFPRREFGLKFNFLRSSTLAVGKPSNLELQTFEGFFNNRLGMEDSFLWTDPEDNSILGQTIGTGDSTGVSFQLYRALGGFVEPIYAPNVLTNVYVGSSVVGSSAYSFTGWGSTVPGVLTFSTTSIPPSGQNVAVDMTFYLPVRFTDDKMTFERFVTFIYDDKKVGFKTII